MLSNRNIQTYETRSLTWWANDKPGVESLLRKLLNRKQIKRASLRKRKNPVHLVAISFHEHGNAEDFHFGKYFAKDKTLKYELDLTRIAAHGRKQRLNCAMEETQKLVLDELSDDERLVTVNDEEYQHLVDEVINKLH